jgi:hypothetical protein
MKKQRHSECLYYFGCLQKERFTCDTCINRHTYRYITLQEIEGALKLLCCLMDDDKNRRGRVVKKEYKK